MEMTASEIVSKYKRGEDKKEQIAILSQLNGCDEETIKRILVDGGVPEIEVYPQKKKRGRKASTAKKETPQEKKAEELELNEEQINRIDEIHNGVYELCRIMTEKSDLEWDMKYIGEIADYIADFLYCMGYKVRYPALVTERDGSQRIEDYHSIEKNHGEINLNTYRTAEMLLEEPEDMTGEEKERLKRIQAIPDVVKAAVKKEIGHLVEEIMKLEKQHDALVDYINGERRE